MTLAAGSANHELALPNKLFHAVRAGVPVVAADLPEIRRTVLRYGFGELYRPGDATSLAAATLRVARRLPELTAAARAAPGRAVVGARRRGARRGVRGAGVRALRHARRRLAVLVANGVHGDSRVQRMARAAADAGWQVLVVGRSPDGEERRGTPGRRRGVLVPVPSVLGRAAARSATRAGCCVPRSVPPGPCWPSATARPGTARCRGGTAAWRLLDPWVQDLELRDGAGRGGVRPRTSCTRTTGTPSRSPPAAPRS